MDSITLYDTLFPLSTISKISSLQLVHPQDLWWRLRKRLWTPSLKGNCWFFFFLRNKNVNSNFPPFLPPAAFSLSGIHIHFSFDLLSFPNEFIQTMWIYSDLSQIPHLLWLIKLTSAKKGGSVWFEIHIGSDMGFGGNDTAQSKAARRSQAWVGRSLVRPSWLPAPPRIQVEKQGERGMMLCVARHLSLVGDMDDN